MGAGREQESENDVVSVAGDNRSDVSELYSDSISECSGGYLSQNSVVASNVSDQENFRVGHDNNGFIDQEEPSHESYY